MFTFFSDFPDDKLLYTAIRRMQQFDSYQVVEIVNTNLFRQYCFIIRGIVFTFLMQVSGYKQDEQ